MIRSRSELKLSVVSPCGCVVEAERESRREDVNIKTVQRLFGCNSQPRRREQHQHQQCFRSSCTRLFVRSPTTCRVLLKKKKCSISRSLMVQQTTFWDARQSSIAQKQKKTTTRPTHNTIALRLIELKENIENIPIHSHSKRSRARARSSSAICSFDSFAELRKPSLSSTRLHVHVREIVSQSRVLDFLQCIWSCLNNL